MKKAHLLPFSRLSSLQIFLSPLCSHSRLHSREMMDSAGFSTASCFLLFSRASPSFLHVSSALAWAYAQATVFSWYTSSSMGPPWASVPLGVYLLHHGSPPPPWILVFPLSFPSPQHFVPLLKHIFLEVSPSWLVGSAVPCGGSVAEPSGTNSPAQDNPSISPLTAPWHWLNVHPATGCQRTLKGENSHLDQLLLWQTLNIWVWQNYGKCFMI